MMRPSRMSTPARPRTAGAPARPIRTARRCGAALVLGLIFSGAGTAQQPAVPTQQPLAAPSPLDQPLRMIAEARLTYQGMRDYTCLFIKRERIHGQLLPDNYIDMRVRTQPFSVYLRWLGPANLAGQEACYVAGRNGNRMRVHSTGLAGVVGFVTLDVNDPRVAQNSRHPITEAGIGNLIERFARRWEVERQYNQTQVRIADYVYNQRPCTRVETIHPSPLGGQFYSYRSVVYFDKEHHLPVRVETYDWPRAGGPPDGDLVETYSYVNLRFNVGLADSSFNF